MRIIEKTLGLFKRYASGGYDVATPKEVERCNYILIDVEKHSVPYGCCNPDISSYTSYVFKEKWEMDYYLDEFVSRHDQKKFLKFKLIEPKHENPRTRKD